MTGTHDHLATGSLTAVDPPPGPSRNWSEDLEEFHEESTRDHPIEVLTRGQVLSHLDPLAPTATVVEIGCSTGYLLADLRARCPDARLIGLDFIASGLRKARSNVPNALVAQADACHLPLPDGSADAIVSVNLLEHVADDVVALEEIARVLRPGAPAVLVVPTAPNLYDYYDRFLHHERRYARGEMARKATEVGLDVEADSHLGSVVFPAFWAVKKRNRLRFDGLRGDALADRVQRDYETTQVSGVFGVACALEGKLLDARIRLPFGIRGLTVVRRPVA